MQLEATPFLIILIEVAPINTDMIAMRHKKLVCGLVAQCTCSFTIVTAPTQLKNELEVST